MFACINGQVMIAVILTAVVASCYQAPAPRSPVEQVKREKDTFEEVLQTAATPSPSALNTIKRIGAQSDDYFIKALVANVLPLWKEDENTFYSSTALPLRQSCLDEADREKLQRRRGRATLVYFTVRVSPDGRALNVSKKRGSVEPDLEQLMQQTLSKSRYLPAKSARGYEASNLIVQCRVETAP
jgi:hypothetical protein